MSSGGIVLGSWVLCLGLEAYTQADSLMSQYRNLSEDDLKTQLESAKAQRDASEERIQSNRMFADSLIGTVVGVGLLANVTLNMDWNGGKNGGSAAGPVKGSYR